MLADNFSQQENSPSFIFFFCLAFCRQKLPERISTGQPVRPFFGFLWWMLMWNTDNKLYHFYLRQIWKLTERWEGAIPASWLQQMTQWSIAIVEYWGYYVWEMLKHNILLLYNLSKQPQKHILAVKRYFKYHLFDVKFQTPSICVNDQTTIIILKHLEIFLDQFWNVKFYLHHTFLSFWTFFFDILV